MRTTPRVLLWFLTLQCSHLKLNTRIRTWGQVWNLWFKHCTADWEAVSGQLSQCSWSQMCNTCTFKPKQVMLQPEFHIAFYEKLLSRVYRCHSIKSAESASLLFKVKGSLFTGFCKMMHWDHSVYGYTQQHATATGVESAAVSVRRCGSSTGQWTLHVRLTLS